ncbi:hypothetical protein PTSG_05723 [Salpingoeca rosetta]|uniref:ABC transporter domain-containing protein n=1 Tax=Salpingoeca rosetta (strain ATCC 50818 / BSB-021) TaxID=946362 RepID=F2UB13_SALR5|nr:uncharacterized protein PTSG_05723 [Salpingoeca rosetta]EGD74026.1 hypothetical protein PTSG_05723 [Salpingoeca rosetta]|eukprot:XP_004993588.1 hypothetical protein PTSG_05723 [Salpingoeca rosetta]
MYTVRRGTVSRGLLRHAVALVVVLALTQQQHACAGGVQMEKVQLKDSDARTYPSSCADGTPYTFFVERRDNSSIWILFLQGGALSRSIDEARTRFSSSPRLMSSKESPTAYEAWDLGGLFSHDAALNPAFHDANKVYLPYCSQDLFLGARADDIPVEPSSGGDGDTATQSSRKLAALRFRGALNIMAALEWLDSAHANTPATRVLLSGTSAGGTAAVAHAYALLSTLAQQPSHGTNSSHSNSTMVWLRGAQLQLLVDSSWFVNQDGILEEALLTNQDLLSFYASPGRVHASLDAFAASVTQANGNATGLSVTSSWQRDYFAALADLCGQVSSQGYPVPCCAEVQCSLRALHAHNPAFPVLLLTSKYDPYTLFLGFNAGAEGVKRYERMLLQSKPSLSELAEVMSFAEEYGGVALAQVKRAIQQVSALSVFVSPCFHHGFLVMVGDRQADDGVVRNGMFQFTFVLDMWHTYFANGNVAMPAFVNRWWLATSPATTNNSNSSSTDTQHLHLTSFPACRGVDCDPMCPPVLSILTSEDEWLWTDGSLLPILCMAFFILVIVVLFMCNVCAWYKFRQHRTLLKQLVHESASEQGGARDTIHTPHLEALEAAELYDADPDVLLYPWKAQHLSIAMYGLNVWTHTHKRQLLHDISAFVNPWEMTAILGPSGCGKTTLLKSMAGLIPSNNRNGQVYVNGRLLRTSDEYKSLRVRVGFVPQYGGAYFPSLTVKENMMYAALLRLPASMPLKLRLAKALSTLHTVGLGAHLDTIVGNKHAASGGLSGGQKRKLAVAMELLLDPVVLAMDEPTSGLDSTGTLDLIRWLRAFAERGNTVIISIHQPRSEVFHMFHRVILMKNGHLIGTGEPSAMVELAGKWRDCVQPRSDTSNASKSSTEASSANQNPADLILDEMQREENEEAVMASLETTGVRKRVERAIRKAAARVREIWLTRARVQYSAPPSTAASSSSSSSALISSKHTVAPALSASTPVSSTSPTGKRGTHLSVPAPQSHSKRVRDVYGNSNDLTKKQFRENKHTNSGGDGSSHGIISTTRGGGRGVPDSQHSGDNWLSKKFTLRKGWRQGNTHEGGTGGSTIAVTHNMHGATGWWFCVRALISRYQREMARQLRSNLMVQLLLSMIYMSWLYFDANPAFVLGSTHFSIMYTFPLLVNFTFSASLINTFNAFRLEKKHKTVSSLQVVVASFSYLAAVAIPLTTISIVVIYICAFGGHVSAARLTAIAVLQMETLGIAAAWMCGMAGVAYHFNQGNDFMLTMYSAFVGMAGVFSGYFVGPADAPPPQEAFYYISPFFYTFASLARVSQDGVPSNCHKESGVLPTAACMLGSPAYYLEDFGFDTIPVGVFQLAIFGFMLLFLGVAYLFLRLEDLAKAVPKARGAILRINRVHSKEHEVRKLVTTFSFTVQPRDDDNDLEDRVQHGVCGDSGGSGGSRTPLLRARGGSRARGEQKDGGDANQAADKRSMATTPSSQRADSGICAHDNNESSRTSSQESAQIADDHSSFVVYVPLKEVSQVMLRARRRQKLFQAEKKLLQAYGNVMKGRQPSPGFVLWVLKYCYDDIYVQHEAQQQPKHWSAEPEV